jgi:hypothetical protein
VLNTFFTTTPAKYGMHKHNQITSIIFYNHQIKEHYLNRDMFFMPVMARLGGAEYIYFSCQA